MDLAREVVHDMEAQGEERVLRRTLRPLREVWMTIGMEKVDTHEGITVKALLDSGGHWNVCGQKVCRKTQI